MLRHHLYFCIFLLFALPSCHPEGIEDSPIVNRQVTVDRSTLNVVVKGRGPACLVIGSSVYYPKTFTQTLTDHLTCYFVDLKWFAAGYQEENLDTVTIASIVGDVAQIQEALGLAKPVLVGHSIHGTIATEYAKVYGDQLAGLVVIGSPTAWGNEKYTLHADSLWATASPERKALKEQNMGNISAIDKLTGQEEASASYHNDAPLYWYDAHYDARWLWDDMTVHSTVTQHLFTTVFADYDMFSTAFTLDLPMLVAMGKYDYVIPHTLWPDTHEQLPQLTLHRYDSCGHTPQLEVPQRFDRDLLAWLREHELAE